MDDGFSDVAEKVRLDEWRELCSPALRADTISWNHLSSDDRTTECTSVFFLWAPSAPLDRPRQVLVRAKYKLSYLEPHYQLRRHSCRVGTL